jgi:hypothetical protein
VIHLEEKCQGRHKIRNKYLITRSGMTEAKKYLLNMNIYTLFKIKPNLIS